MNKILFINIVLLLFSFALESVAIVNNNNKIVVDIDYHILYYLKNELKIKDYYEKIFATNPQNCKIRTTDKEYRSCYMTLKYKGEYYNFCGRVKKDFFGNKKTFLKEFVNDLQYKDLIKDRNKQLKIDCYNEKLIYIRYFLLLLIILI